MFAIITPALIVGAYPKRINFPALGAQAEPEDHGQRRPTRQAALPNA
jgi:hypothetical protein